MWLGGVKLRICCRVGNRSTPVIVLVWGSVRYGDDPQHRPQHRAYSRAVEGLAQRSYGLVDREAEVSAAAAAVALAPAGSGGVLVVRGPAGIGKSALLRVAERLAEEQDAIVLRARAAPFE